MILNLADRFWVDEDGTAMAITNAFDRYGEETDDPDECLVIVVAMPDGRFGVVDLSEFSRSTLH